MPELRLFKKKKLTEREFAKEVDKLRRLVREGVEGFRDDTPDARKARKERAETDVLFFMETYLPHYCDEPFAPFHSELIELADAATATEPMAGDAPRGFAKSTVISFGYALHKIVYKSKRFIIEGGETETQAAGITASLMVELEENPRIKSDFGRQKGPSWSDGDFTTSTGVRVLARGSGQAIRGLKNGPHRPDLIILDDIESDESVNNPKRIKAAVKWVLSAVVPSLNPKTGALFVVGTMLAKKSVLATLKANPQFKSFHFQAIQPDGSSLWPERHSVEHLEAIKRLVGTKVFNAEYMGNPQDDEASFKAEWLENFYEPALLDGMELVTVTYGDPSSESGHNNDYKAVITVSVCPAGIYVRHAWIRHATPSGFTGALYDQHESYKPEVVASEDNAIGEFLRSALTLAAQERGYPLALLGLKHTTNKEARINRLSPLAEHGKLYFLKGHSDQDLLREQLEAFPSSSVNDDGPDALEGAIALAEGRARKAATGSVDPEPAKKTAGMIGRTMRRLGIRRRDDEAA